MMKMAGDDTGICYDYLGDRNIMTYGLRRICHARQEVITHGLGLILKVSLIDENRMNILSREICQYEGEVVMLRQLENTILTNTTCSQKVT